MGQCADPGTPRQNMLAGRTRTMHRQAGRQAAVHAVLVCMVELAGSSVGVCKGKGMGKNGKFKASRQRKIREGELGRYG